MPKKREIAKGTLGWRLRSARESKQLTLEAIGKHVGCSPQAVAQWEYGESEPDVDTLRILTRLLEVSLAELFGDVAGSIDEFTKRYERALEILPTSQPMIVDISADRCVMDGVYLVRLRKGDRTKGLLGRVVWPKV